jgi:hypothetical protein
MALQYLEALKALAAGDSTKWIVPMELSELTRPISAVMRQTLPPDSPERSTSG